MCCDQHALQDLQFDSISCCLDTPSLESSIESVSSCDGLVLLTVILQQLLKPFVHPLVALLPASLLLTAK